MRKALEHEQTEQSKEILRNLQKDDPSIDAEQGMKSKVMSAFLTVTKMFKREKGTKEAQPKKDKRRPSLKCMSCGVFKCKKGHWPGKVYVVNFYFL